ncbi:MAG TPA: AlkA N-terminal domain-containing protein [Burkholderiales bacterium]|nr:AlkA N-terminal domain-containing protein [Burkholderiales bacterium]
MLLDATHCYQAFKTHDPRFDGRFFVGVSSTRVYCRPVCAVKTPKRENCRFFPSAAAAESAGFRPCLRCRPELAPGNAGIDARARLAQTAAGLIEDGLLHDSGIDGLAARLGVTDRHLRRVFRTEFGVSPVAFVQTQRLLLAKRLLTDTTMSMTQVAMASGFGSLRRFNALLRTRYRFSPSDLRRRVGGPHPSDVLTFELGYRPPLEWDALLSFLGRRAIEGVECIDGARYARTVHIEKGGKRHSGWIAARLAKRKAAIELQVSGSLGAAVPAVLGRAKRLLDLSCDPAQIALALGPLAARRPGLRLPGAYDGFELAVRAILGQQITVKAARTLAGRFAVAFGESIETPVPSLRWLFPTAQRVAALKASDVAAIGVVGTRANAIVSLARAVCAGGLALDPGAEVAATLERLRTLPGIGEWTAQYIAMRALSWPDAFPHTDHGVLKALGERDARKALARASAWQPWRAYAVMHLWRSLEEPNR